MRLAKFLATAGMASRRASEEIVRNGRVTVGGATVTDPARDVGPTDQVELDGSPVAPVTERVVYMVNKPAGVVSTARDPQRRPTVVSLVAAEFRLYPVGRLDADTTGLILLTNDGDLAHRLTHPRFEVPKTYRVKVAGGPVGQAALQALGQGVRLEDGLTAPAKARLLAPDVIELTISEGRKRQVKRMCQAVGHRVHSLERVRFGPLELGSLKVGRHRRLSEREVHALAEAGTPPKQQPQAGARRQQRPRAPAPRQERPRAPGARRERPGTAGARRERPKRQDRS
jgi:23S rRNA pseudouridine2605 synthase